MTLCAETSAVGNAVSAGHRKFKAVAVATDLPKEHPTSLCGRCRQVIREFTSSETPILMVCRDGSVIVQTMEQILPGAPTPQFLQQNHEEAAASC